MADTLTSITNLITSPPTQLAAGGLLAGIVWKLFERLENVLTSQTKLEIAVWLVGVRVGQKVEPWPETFTKLFDRAFGTKHLSWKCFLRSALTSTALLVAAFATAIEVFLMRHHLKSSLLSGFQFPGWRSTGVLLLVVMFTNILPDYLSLLESRVLLGVMRRSESIPLWTLALLGDIWLTVFIGFTPVIVLSAILANQYGSLLGFFESAMLHPIRLIESAYWYISVSPVVILPAFFTSIWLWLYAGSGLILKAARRFDIGFDWFNRKFDIEKKPLQSIGLVAGVLVAIMCWGLVLVFRVAGS